MNKCFVTGADSNHEDMLPWWIRNVQKHMPNIDIVIADFGMSPTMLKTITKEGISALANQFSDLVVKDVIDAPYVPGALQFIKKFSEKCKLFISTGTPTEEMQRILVGRNIARYFTEVFGSPTKKLVHLTSILKNYNLNQNEIIFYGDSNSDLEATEHLKIPFVLIKNRFNQALSNEYEGEIINNFNDLSCGLRKLK